LGQLLVAPVVQDKFVLYVSVFECAFAGDALELFKVFPGVHWVRRVSAAFRLRTDDFAVVVFLKIGASETLTVKQILVVQVGLPDVCGLLRVDIGLEYLFIFFDISQSLNLEMLPV